eukprot:4074629-Alexandrium_andersonii.AAC.1
MAVSLGACLGKPLLRRPAAAPSQPRPTKQQRVAPDPSTRPAAKERATRQLSLIHISEPTRLALI